MINRASTLDEERMFYRTEWLTKSQIQSFFSRLSMKIQEGQVVTTAKNTKSKSEDDEDALEEHECQEDEEEHLTGIRQTVLDKIRCVIQSPMTCTIYAN